MELNQGFSSQALKTSVVVRAKAIWTKGVWPAAVTALTGTTMEQAASRCLWALGYFLFAHPRHSWTWPEGSHAEVSGRKMRRAGSGGRNCRVPACIRTISHGLKKKK